MWPPWWRHQMETFSALLAICAGNSPVPGEFPTQRPVTWNFGVFFDLRLNKQLSKQPRGWWFGTLLGSLWRQCNDEATGPPWLPHTKASDVNVTLMFSLICVWINGWINSREAGDLGRYWVHYDVSVMMKQPTGFAATIFFEIFSQFNSFCKILSNGHCFHLLRCNDRCMCHWNGLSLLMAWHLTGDQR